MNTKPKRVRINRGGNIIASVPSFPNTARSVYIPAAKQETNIDISKALTAKLPTPFGTPVNTSRIRERTNIYEIPRGKLITPSTPLDVLKLKKSKKTINLTGTNTIGDSKIFTIMEENIKKISPDKSKIKKATLALSNAFGSILSKLTKSKTTPNKGGKRKAPKKKMNKKSKK